MLYEFTYAPASSLSDLVTTRTHKKLPKLVHQKVLRLAKVLTLTHVVVSNSKSQLRSTQ